MGTISKSNISTDDSNKDVTAEVYFLAREEKYEHEKPYTLRYNPGTSVPQTNINMKPIPVKIRDMRSRISQLDWEIYGFQMMRTESLLRYEDYVDRGQIIDTHVPMICKFLLKQLSARSVRIFDYGVSNEKHDQMSFQG